MCVRANGQQKRLPVRRRRRSRTTWHSVAGGGSKFAGRKFCAAPFPASALSLSLSRFHFISSHLVRALSTLPAKLWPSVVRRRLVDRPPGSQAANLQSKPSKTNELFDSQFGCGTFVGAKLEAEWPAFGEQRLESGSLNKLRLSSSAQ